MAQYPRCVCVWLIALRSWPFTMRVAKCRVVMPGLSELRSLGPPQCQIASRPWPVSVGVGSGYCTMNCQRIL